LRAPALRKAEISVEKTLEHLTETAYAKVRKATTRQEKLRGLELLMKHQGLFERDNLHPRARDHNYLAVSMGYCINALPHIGNTDVSRPTVDWDTS
jgi:hypothetical protein